MIKNTQRCAQHVIKHICAQNCIVFFVSYRLGLFDLAPEASAQLSVIEHNNNGRYLSLAALSFDFLGQMLTMTPRIHTIFQAGTAD